MGGKTLTTSVRLTDKEQELIRKKSVEINQTLIKKGMQPLRDSQIIHEILDLALPYLEIGESGKIIIGSE